MIYGALEIEIMNKIWSIQEQDEDVDISVGDISNYLNENNNTQRAYTTIKTVMDRLVCKDILVRYRSGKKFFYRSVVDRDEAIKYSIDEISNNFFGGDYPKMLRFIEKECEYLLV